jgi:two-component system, NtrC family, response regulator AtoC
MLSDDDKVLRMGMSGLVGVSTLMQRVYKLVNMVSAYGYAVSIVGEMGTGKEVTARLIHSASNRRNKAFIGVSRSMFVPSWIESELFGYERGAGGQLTEPKVGLLGVAGTGTIYFDEVAELPVGVQSKLNRALEENEYWPIGTTHPRPFGARVIAASHHNLEAQVKAGAFREDLYFQLNAVQIRLPPLRDRKSDIPLLVDAFLDKYEEVGSTVGVSEAAMNCLVAYDWPGNVRELEMTVQRALAFTASSMIEPSDLLHVPRAANQDKITGELQSSQELELERQALTEALREASGDKLAAAKLLGINESTLGRRLKYHRLDSLL